MLEQARNAIETYNDCNADKPAANYYTGNILSDMAKLEPDTKKKRALLILACDKYQAAGTWEDDWTDVRVSHGLVLGELSELEDHPDKKTAFLQQACEQYREASTRDASNARLWYNWALFLTEIAGLTGDIQERRSLLNEACAKLQEAARLEDTRNFIWGLWGCALRDLAEVQDSEEERYRCLEQAKEKALYAFSLNLETAAYDYACYAALLGNVEECRQWLAKAEEGDALPPFEHLQTDKDLDGVRETAWFQELLTRLKFPKP